MSSIADDLRSDKESGDSDRVDEILTEVIDRQIKQKKILDSVTQEAIEFLNEEGGEDGSSADDRHAENLEGLLVAAQDVQEQTSEAVGNVLVTIEVEAEDITAKLIEVVGEQRGSQFKHFKHIEILEDLKNAVPADAQEAIDRAKATTQSEFEDMLERLPAGVRVERFSEYVEHIPGDQVHHLAFLDDLKLGDVPVDILESIERIKEFTLGKIEAEVETYSRRDDELRDRFFEQFDEGGVENILIAQQLADRLNFEDERLEERMREVERKSVEEFSNRFTDDESAEQLEEYELLQSILLERPGDPAAHRLLSDLEDRVKQDPEKRAFLEEFADIGQQMASKFETQFRKEGDRALERYITLDPRDMEVFFDLEDRGRFDGEFVDRFAEKQVDHFKDFVRDVRHDEFDEFDRVMDRFHHVDQGTVDYFHDYDPYFDDAIQNKRRRVEEARLQYEEQEIFHEMDRLRRQQEDEFWREYNTSDPDQRAVLLDDRYDEENDLLEKELEERRRIAQERFANDPFCDEVCREVQASFLDQEYRHRQLDVQDEYRRRVDEEDRLREQDEQFRLDEEFRRQEEERKRLVLEEASRSCAPNEYFDWGREFCVNDPYWQPPIEFTNCPYGQVWFDEFGYCGYDDIEITPVIVPIENVELYCEPGFYPDYGLGYCVKDPYYRPYEPAIYCGPGSYYDHFTGGCEQDYSQNCAPWEYFDYGRQTCVVDHSIDNDPQNCPIGTYWDYGYNRCETGAEVPQWEQCASYGGYWDAETQNCLDEKPEDVDDPDEPDGPDDPDEPEFCPTVYSPVCGTNGVSYTNDCNARVSGVTIAYYGTCTGPSTCTGDFEYWDKVTETCRTSYKDCGPGEEWDSFSQSCRAFCPAGEKWNSVRGQCEFYFDGAVDCAWGWNWNPYTESCVQEGVSCANDISVCNECRSDYLSYGALSLAPNHCTYAADGCPIGCSWDQPIDTDCPPGHEFSWASGSCVPLWDQDYGPWDPTSAAGQCMIGLFGEARSKQIWEVDKIGTPEEEARISAECPFIDDGDDEYCPYYDVSPCLGCSDEKCVTDDKGCMQYCSEFDLIEKPTVNCPDGWFYSEKTNSCVQEGFTCNSPAACDSCSASQECEYYSNGCPMKCKAKTTNPYEKACEPGYYWVSLPENPQDGYCTLDTAAQSCPNNPYAINSTNDCDYSVCENGCNYEGSCPISCSTDPGPSDPNAITCSQNQFNTSPYVYSCDFTVCSENGCDFDTNGCAIGCSTGAVGSCNNDQYCNSNESADTCSDCSDHGPGTPTSGSCDYDNYCDPGEYSSSCSDCHDGDYGGCENYNNSSSCNSVTNCEWGNGYCYYQSGSPGGSWDADGCDDSSQSACEAITNCYWSPADSHGPGYCYNSSSAPTGSGCNYDGVCTLGETYEGCSGDCPYGLNNCGNGTCEPGEDHGNCSQDCDTSVWDQDYDQCNNNGYCDYNESGYSCPNDCSGYSAYDCDNDGSCDPNEDSWSCPNDCTGSSTGGSGSCDFDGWCDSPYENSSTCSSDCTADGSSVGNTGGGCNYDGFCGPGEDSYSCDADCNADNYTYDFARDCGNNYCESSESNASCPADCDESTGGYLCDWDGYCESATNETYNDCPGDCNVTGGDVNNDPLCNRNGICDGIETYDTCAYDCTSPGQTGGGTSYEDLGFWKRLSIGWDSFISKLLDRASAGRY